MQCVRQKLLQTISANCKREQSGMGSSQPCAMTKTETAAMAIQPLGDTWRHYNPEGGERVMRKAVLARCGLRQSPQRPNIADDEGGQRRSMLDRARRRCLPAEQPDVPFCPSCKLTHLQGAY